MMSNLSPAIANMVNWWTVTLAGVAAVMQLALLGAALVAAAAERRWHISLTALEDSDDE